MNTTDTEQFARPDIPSIYQIFFKRLAIDRHESRVICLSIKSSNLSGCYDGIIHIAAALAFLRVGISQTNKNDLIQCIVHRIIMSFGDLELTNVGNNIVD